MTTILNTSIITAEGNYSLKKITLEDAKTLVKNTPYQSAIGHQSTADILTSLLGVEVKLNRIQYEQKEFETALVFKLKGRPEEGKILSVKEIENIGYEFFTLYRRGDY
jgi:hypothetical protein